MAEQQVSYMPMSLLLSIPALYESLRLCDRWKHACTQMHRIFAAVHWWLAEPAHDPERYGQLSTVLLLPWISSFPSFRRKENTKWLPWLSLGAICNTSL